MKGSISEWRGRGRRAGTAAMLLSVFASGLRVSGADWLAYRGPTTDGVCPEAIETDWPAGGPPVLWRAALTHGFSSVTVTGGRVFTLIKRNVGADAYEFCVALDAGDGRELWATPLGTAQYYSGAYGPAGSSDGPRSTPVVHEGRIFILDRALKLWCLEAASGAVVWSKDIKQLYGGSIPTWEYAASPLIDEGRLFLNGGGSGQSLLALATSDGGLLWKTRSEVSTYATPVRAVIHGVEQIVFLTAHGLRSLNGETGALLWQHDFGNSGMFAASPVVAGDIVYASGGYDVGAVGVRVALASGRFTATRIWRASGQLMNHWTSGVQRDGYLYGLFGHADYNDAPLKCIDLRDSRELWSVDGFGQGGLLLAGDRLLVLGAKRELVVVEADPAMYREVARVTPFTDTRGKCWNAPAVSDGVLYARSTREIVALDVSLPAPPPIRMAELARVAGSRLRIVIAGADGAPIDPARAARIAVLTSVTPSAPGEEGWARVDAPLVAEGGTLTLELDVAPGDRVRYFKAVEQQP